MRGIKCCSGCRETKSTDQFSKNRSTKDGLQTRCKSCVTAYRNSRPELQLQYTAAYREVHREEERARSAAYYAAYPDRCYTRSAAWKAANPDKIRTYNQSRRAQKRNLLVGGSPVTAEGIAARFAVWGNRCWICGRAEGAMHADHIKPLSRGGLHILANIRPACPPCNTSKGAQWPYTKELR